ncbi:hypothetical protein EO98_04715 [Methanosarcina sp. 2.H.T.1A.6]|nr:hypothetical protein EO97_16385 [Methanosarcina sp. 2.H.T.1A.15]KKG20478.1 hypothetical protein EO96_16870 [Methanosarcina sp. 2.H.T.1A.8]KKG21286.1 hypothetical protein EO98_04715 [Methanosarcina sp. 2.H.T.1A.6]
MSNISSDFIVWLSQPFYLIFKLLSVLFFIIVLAAIPPCLDGEGGMGFLIVFMGLLSFICFRISKLFHRSASIQTD